MINYPFNYRFNQIYRVVSHSLSVIYANYHRWEDNRRVKMEITESRP